MFKRAGVNSRHHCAPTLPMKRYFDHIPYGPFIGLPQPVARSRYDSAIELLISQWASSPCPPISIYQIGDISVPGISDLDFVLVIPDGRLLDTTRYQPNAFPRWVQQLMIHPPFFSPKSVWPYFTACFPTFKLKYLWGEVLEQPVVPKEMQQGCYFGILIDYLTVKMPCDLLSVSWKHPIRVNILLGVISSIKHTFKIAELAGLNMPTADLHILKKIDEMRTSWFEMGEGKFEILAKLCADVCEMTGRLILSVDAKLSEAIGKMNCKPLGPEVGLTTLFRFTDRWNLSSVMRESFECYSESGEIKWVNPSSFLDVLAVYVAESAGFGKYLNAQGLPLKLRWDGGVWNKGLCYHARAITLYGDAISKSGLAPQKYIGLNYSPLHPFWQNRDWKLIQRYIRKIIKKEIRPIDVLKRMFFEIRRLF